MIPEAPDFPVETRLAASPAANETEQARLYG
jgi:hypothetical protein